MSEEDCRNLVVLMKNGFSFTDSAGIMKTAKNAEAFQAIEDRLVQGTALGEVLPAYCPKTYRKWYEGFSQCLPFLESMSMTVTLCTKSEQQKKELAKGIVYPLCLSAGVLMGISAFAGFVLPSMISLMNGFGLASGGLQVLRKGIVIVSSLLSFLLAAGLAIGLYAVQEKRIAASYRLVCRWFPDSFPIRYASQQFVSYFLECCRVNVSTKESMELLAGLKERPLTALIAGELNAGFLLGQTMEEASVSPYVEHALSYFMRIAVHSSDSIRMMEGYLQMCNERTKRNIRNFSRMVQMVSYMSTGVMLILVYRVLLMPLQMLQTL